MPREDDLQNTVITNSPHETERVGEEFASSLKGGELILLVGDLGSGKTVFVRGLARGLGIDPDDVSSPSYTIVNEYPGRITLVHADLYRLDSPNAIEELALDELLVPDAVVVIEWGEKLPALPAQAAVFKIDIVDEERRRIGQCEN